MKMIKDRLLVKPIKIERTTIKNFVMEKDPDKKRKFIEHGTLINIGPSVLNKLNVGDTVYYGRYAGTSVSIDGENHLVIKEDEIDGFRRV